MTGAQPVPGESALYAVKTIAWGMPDVSGASAVNTCVHTHYHQAHTGLRVHWAPGIPRALVFKGRKVSGKLSGASRSGARKHVCIQSSLRDANSARECAP